MNTATILIVGDKPRLSRDLRAALAGLGYSVMEAATGDEAQEVLRHEPADLILLDLPMPGVGGLETCRAMRECFDIPIIILSARKTEDDTVEALDAGADDYITKPCGIQELIARIRAALRRASSFVGGEPTAFVSAELTIDFEFRRVTLNGKSVRLTPKELDLLMVLVSNPDRPIPHRKLLQTVWGPDYSDDVKYLRVAVNRLRRKIEPVPSAPKYLVSESWVGYRFATPGAP